MSSHYRPHDQHAHHHPHDDGRALQRRHAHQGRPQAAPRHNPHSYTLVHHGKQVRVAPVVFWVIVGTIVVMGVWSAVTATYFAFRDDVLTKLLSRQAEMQYAYEDRIAELRSRIDRTTSRQALDQEQYDQKLSQIMKRQSLLESRANALAGLPDTGATGSIKSSRPLPSNDNGGSGIPKPSPINDTVIFATPPDREARLESRRPAPDIAPTRFASNQDAGGLLARLQSSLDKVESRQTSILTAAEDSYDARLRRMQSLFSDLGLNAAQMRAATPKAAVGGPFIPAKPPGRNADPFERQLYRVNLARSQVESTNRTLAMVPYRKPVIGEVEFTSGFGIRTDPFLGRPAMHTGLDFRASTGDPVRATANGVVSSAGWAGGYGRMVEINHGNGLATRYGHLSQINVKVGDVIKIGQVIGEVGSTGRSTGPHLHYETRIDGEAVDPQRFLRAGIRFAQG
ncbi:MAG: M23 family metallopeptidase [Xanthobacteraceae bacterium]|nr:M23 family metallopeptidase [Xanthobacteraceae bacterium]